MKFSTLLLAVLPLSLLGQVDMDLSNFTSQASNLLMRHVNEGKVDYQNLPKDDTLDALVTFISNFDYSTLNLEEEKAYLVNVYNILVLKGVTQHYPLNSLLKIFGFFDQVKWQIGNEKFTLDELEKDYILKKFEDARLHFALACGATGCPPLASFAYTTKGLDEQLNDRTKEALNDPTFVRIDGAEVGLSQIFNWYAKDFGGNRSAVLNYINGFRSQSLDLSSAVSHYPYDWTLNDQKVNTLATNASRYVVSSTVPKGGYELKIFNKSLFAGSATKRFNRYSRT